MTTGWPAAEYINRVVCPPKPEPLGSQTARAHAAATAASMALPPAWSISTAALLASGKAVTAIWLPARADFSAVADKAGERELSAISSMDR
jgi:hypothetical protein